MRSEFDASLSADDIERPKCIKCGTLMWLTKVMVVCGRETNRDFECPVCSLHSLACERQLFPSMQLLSRRKRRANAVC